MAPEIEFNGRQAGKQTANAINTYHWIRTSPDGSRGIVFFADRTVEITIKVKEIT